ncbi:MAG: DUF3300 domain-containing protein [Nitrospirota bacterium]
MRSTRMIMASLAWIIIAMLMIPGWLPAQDFDTLEQPEKFSKEELAQMLAPIALYPDSLIAQILMASTYPLEVVEAERWLRQNRELKGDSLDNALQLKSWDPSVKSLCHFPDILFAMSEKLDQTRKLGDAFLVQEGEAMDVIQELREKARDQGNLKSTAEQKVIIEREIIRIEPIETRTIYIPIYDPLYVYGPWWYPAYPPYYWYYPPGLVYSGGYISYSPPIFLGIGFWSWTWFDWHVRHIYIDVHKTKRFHRHRDRRDSGRVFWRHDPSHRKGVAYRDRRTSERFIGSKPRASSISPASQEMRGYPSGSYRKKASESPKRPVGIRKGSPAPGVRIAPKTFQQTPTRDTPFRGIGNGSFERRASERGNESRRNIDVIRPGRSIRQQDDGFRDSGRGGVFRR